MSNTVEINFIAKSIPSPIGLLALSHYLQTLTNNSTKLNINFVHSLPTGNSVSLDVAGTTILGQNEIYKKLGDIYAAEGVCGKDKNESTQIEAILLLTPAQPWSFATVATFLASLEKTITLRTFLVGHTISIADWAIWGSLKGSQMALGQVGKCVHLNRWFNFISSLPAATTATEEMAVQYKVKPVKQAKKEGDEPKANATFELGLPNAQMGNVTTRFPPEPSGYLHIGHAKAAILNQYFAKHYGGKFLVRFDDTNPSKEKAEFEQSIIEDLELLGIKGDGPSSYTSDFFDKLHIYCVQMIKAGHAYADDTEQLKMRDERWNGIASVHRDMSVADSLVHFDSMCSGSAEGTKWCIRAKVSVDDPNKAMRDPVIYRCNALPHHRTGDKFKAYPTYDFACPIVDCLQGVTHALRTNEYRDRNPLYAWMLEHVGLRKIEIWDYGRISFVYTLLSKRKLKWFVDEGIVRGWDDPRFATVRGIRRRGMTIEALNQYMLLQGPSQAVTNLEWDVIWNLNKKVIDPVAPRYVALNEAGCVKVTLTGSEVPKETESKMLPKHKKTPEVGEKKSFFTSEIYLEQEDALSFDKDEEITLMDWGNAFVRTITYSTTHPTIIESLSLELNLTGDFKKTKKKVTWLPSTPSVPVTLLDYDYLITKKKLEELDEISTFINPSTEFRVEARADHNLLLVKKGDIIQFERKGYYIIEKANGEESTTGGKKEGVEAILIPDGRAAAVALKYVQEKKEVVAASKGKKAEKKSAAATTKVYGFPEVAPLEAVESTLLSEGTGGFEMKYLTKMFKTESIIGSGAPAYPSKANIHVVPSLYEQKP